MLAVIESNTEFNDVSLVSIPESTMGYIEIELSVVGDVSYLVDVCDVGRCGENIIGFYCTDDDEYRWLIGESDEITGVMRLVDTAYALAEEVRDASFQF